MQGGERQEKSKETDKNKIAETILKPEAEKAPVNVSTDTSGFNSKATFTPLKTATTEGLMFNVSTDIDELQETILGTDHDDDDVFEGTPEDLEKTTSFNSEKSEENESGYEGDLSFIGRFRRGFSEVAKEFSPKKMRKKITSFRKNRRKKSTSSVINEKETETKIHEDKTTRTPVKLKTDDEKKHVSFFVDKQEETKQEETKQEETKQEETEQEETEQEETEQEGTNTEYFKSESPVIVLKEEPIKANGMSKTQQLKKEIPSHITTVPVVISQNNETNKLCWKIRFCLVLLGIIVLLLLLWWICGKIKKKNKDKTKTNIKANIHSVIQKIF